ncbi:hypothetical protein [Flavobacterium sp. BFFFF1]|uniref:hypothetical protein n=1 Tax=Flavobacterium sp. BFFFF1 TaxID=2015557 RepID=UPI0025C39DD9|nr:hypothetical protein [Flavobacterium sp. BFFFF1]
METHEYPVEVIANKYYWLDGILNIISIIVILAILYFIIRLYRKIVRFLDKNS